MMAMKPTKAQPILLAPLRKNKAGVFSAFQPVVASSALQVRELLPNVEKGSLWIGEDRLSVIEFLKAVTWPAKSLGRIVLLFEPPSATLPALRKCFDRIAFGPADRFLPPDELAEAMSAPHREELFIGGLVNHESQIVTLWRGDFDSLEVPFSAFDVSGDGIAPDFNAFSVTDYGQTVRLGEYEAAADALLYEFDEKFRRRKNKDRLKTEQGLGASIRRLRKQRGLRRDDFAPLDPKTIARIEQGKVSTIHDKTKQAIANKLRVKAEELASY